MSFGKPSLLPNELFLHDKLDQFLHPGRLWVEANLCSTRQSGSGRTGKRSCDFKIVILSASSTLCCRAKLAKVATWKLRAPTWSRRWKKESNSRAGGETGLHDFGGWTVGSFGDQLDAPQVVRRDDPGLHLQAAAAAGELTADWRHTCQKWKDILVQEKKTPMIIQVYSETGLCNILQIYLSILFFFFILFLIFVKWNAFLGHRACACNRSLEIFPHICFMCKDIYESYFLFFTHPLSPENLCMSLWKCKYAASVGLCHRSSWKHTGCCLSTSLNFGFTWPPVCLSK